MGYTVDKDQKNGVVRGKTRYRFDYKVNGNRRRKMVQCYPSQVTDLYRKWEREQETETPKAKSRKLFEMIDMYLAYIAERRHPSYVKSHRNELSFLMEFVGNLPVDGIRRFHIKDFKDWRKQHTLLSHKGEVSARTINYSISVFSVFFNWMIDRELYIRANPASRCKDPEDNFRHVVLNPDQIAELLSKAKGKSIWLYTGVMLALFAGLRRKEIIELKWGDIDLLHGVINLRAAATKSKRQRSIPIPNFLENHLTSLNRDGEWLLMENGLKVLLNKFWYNWERLRDSLSFAHLPNGLRLTFHDLRHVYAQSLRDAGINLGDIQAYMGHSSVELTVRRYAQRGGIDGRAKVNKLAEVYNIQ